MNPNPTPHRPRTIANLHHTEYTGSRRMRYTYARALRDEELLPHLERGDTIIFTEAVKHWQDIESQVERLGFGDNFAVSRGSRPAPAGRQNHIRIIPLHTPAQA